MDTKEKWTVSPIYVENFDKHDFVCEYNPTTGRYNERLRDEISNKELTTGYYVKVNDLMFGVFATTKGPVLFKNDSQFLLEQGKYRMQVDKKLDKNIFCLTINEKQEFQVEYEKPKHINYDAWSDEEMVDFFLWLSQKNQKKFHEYYTINN